MNSYIFEAIEHGRKFPINAFITSINHSSYHWHYDYELILVLKGEVLVNTRRGQVHLKTGDIFLLNSISVHELQRTEQKNICLFIQLNQSLFIDSKNTNESYFFYLDSTSKGKDPKNGFEPYKGLAAKIGLEFQKELPNMYRINSYVYALIADFYDYLLYDIHQTSNALNSVEDIELLMQIINYVQENYAVADIHKHICKVFGMSEKTMYRFLKKYIGLSPKALTKNNRINASKEMLRMTEKSVPFISSECGFSADSTFHRVFKKEVGVTPNEYRNKEVFAQSDMEIKGYLAFNHREARQLLQHMIKECNENEV